MGNKWINSKTLKEWLSTEDKIHESIEQMYDICREEDEDKYPLTFTYLREVELCEEEIIAIVESEYDYGYYRLPLEWFDLTEEKLRMVLRKEKEKREQKEEEEKKKKLAEKEEKEYRRYLELKNKFENTNHEKRI